MRPGSSSSTSSKSKDDDPHKETIKQSDTPVIIPTPPASSQKKKDTGKKDNSSSAKQSGSSDKSRQYSSSTGRLKNGASTVMKNGILYIIDDDDTDIGPGDPKESGRIETEDIESEKEYSASDLATEKELQEMEEKVGFFDTIPGILAIAGCTLLILALLLFFLFFGVIVTGEVEEHDEVFELCSIRIMMRKDGNWKVNLGQAFDENAVLKLRPGLLFALIFEGVDVIGTSSGEHEGEVTGQIATEVLLYRKNIRRSV